MLFSGRSGAQEKEKAPDKEKVAINHNLGFAWGTTSAYGLSYRFYVNRFGIFTTYSPYIDKEITAHHLGYGILFNLIEGESSTLFLYQSNYYMWEFNKQEDFKTQYSNHGLGLGIEFIILKVIGLNAMMGYGSYKDFVHIGVTVEGGLYYKF